MKTLIVSAAVALVLHAPGAAAITKDDTLLKECRIQSRQSQQYIADTYYLRTSSDSYGFYTTNVTKNYSSVTFRHTLVYAGDYTGGGGKWFIVEASTGKCLVPYQKASGGWIVSAAKCENIDKHKWIIQPETAITTASYRVISLVDNNGIKYWNISGTSATRGQLNLNKYSTQDDQRFFIKCTDLKGDSAEPDRG